LFSVLVGGITVDIAPDIPLVFLWTLCKVWTLYKVFSLGSNPSKCFVGVSVSKP
jgi:hypothetical protein